MSSKPSPDRFLFRRRDLGVAALALGTAATLKPDVSAAQGPILRALEGIKDSAEGKVAYFRAMEAYLYGFPLVIMDLTRQVTTATPRSGDLAAPINQWGRMRTVVPRDFKNVVRISTNSLWSFAFVDLAKEPMSFPFPTARAFPSLSGRSTCGLMFSGLPAAARTKFPGNFR